MPLGSGDYYEHHHLHQQGAHMVQGQGGAQPHTPIPPHHHQLVGNGPVYFAPAASPFYYYVIPPPTDMVNG